MDTVVNITNKSATPVHDKTPIQRLLDQFYPDRDNSVSLGHLGALGCNTYVEIPKERRVASDKPARRADVGILVGYEGTNIFRVYVSSRKGLIANKRVRCRKVWFNEGGLRTNHSPWSPKTSVISSLNPFQVLKMVLLMSSASLLTLSGSSQCSRASARCGSVQEKADPLSNAAAKKVFLVSVAKLLGANANTIWHWSRNGLSFLRSYPVNTSGWLTLILPPSAMIPNELGVN